VKVKKEEVKEKSEGEAVKSSEILFKSEHCWKNF
jgi:hypothetical protein